MSHCVGLCTRSSVPASTRLSVRWLLSPAVRQNSTRTARPSLTSSVSPSPPRSATPSTSRSAGWSASPGVSWWRRSWSKRSAIMSRLKSVTKSPHNTVPSPTPRHSSCLIFHPYLYYLTNAMQECEPLAPDCRIVQETVCGNAGYSPSDSPPPPPPHSRAHINQHYGLGKREAQASRQEKSYNKAGYQGFRYGPHLGPLGFGPLARLPVAPGGSDPWPGRDNKGQSKIGIVLSLSGHGCTKIPRQVCEHQKPACRKVPHQECKPTTERKCHAVPKPHCTKVARKVPRKECGSVEKEHCQYFPEQICETVSQQKCEPVSRERCEQIPQTHCVGKISSISHCMP